MLYRLDRSLLPQPGMRINPDHAAEFDKLRAEEGTGELQFQVKPG